MSNLPTSAIPVGEPATCSWCGHPDDCEPGKPGQSKHHSLCCTDRYFPPCMKPAPKPHVPPKGKTGRPGYITKAQLRAIAIGLKNKTRDESLAWISDLIGREVTSRTDLTKREASRVIDEMRTP